MPNLGDKVRDTITNMTGIITETSQRLDQPTRYFVEGQANEKSLLQIDCPTFWATEGRIEVLQQNYYQNMKTASRGKSEGGQGGGQNQAEGGQQRQAQRA